MISVGKIAGFLIMAAALLGLAFYAGHGCGKSSADKKLAEANHKLATSEETIKIKDGLFAEKAHEIDDLRTALDEASYDQMVLAEQLAKTKEELLTVTQISVQWRKKYESLLKATQSEEPGEPTEPGGEPVVRKRVDFTGDLGPFRAEGYTLTDPPEAKVSIQQIKALGLTVAVAQGKDGKWNTYVSSDDPDVDIDVRLTGVDPLVLSPSWKERIRIDLQGLPLGTPAVGYGVSYEFDRWSIGAGCVSSFSASSSTGCGVNIGLKPFK